MVLPFRRFRKLPSLLGIVQFLSFHINRKSVIPAPVATIGENFTKITLLCSSVSCLIVKFPSRAVFDRRYPLVLVATSLAFAKHYLPCSCKSFGTDSFGHQFAPTLSVALRLL